MLAWSGTPSNRETSQAAAETQEGATKRDLVGICLRELTWWTAGSEGGGMGISNSYLPAGAREGTWPVGHFQKETLFLLTRKEAGVSSWQWTSMVSLPLSPGSSFRRMGNACQLYHLSPHPSLFSYLLTQSSVCHTTLVYKSRSFP